MNRLSKNEKGFGVVEAILILIILILIGVIGYMVYKNHHKTTAATTTATSATKPSKTTKQSTASSTPTQPASSTQYLKITQLGIELLLSSTISDLSYTWYVNTSDGGVGYAVLNSNALMNYAAAQDPSECAPSSSSWAGATSYSLGSLSQSTTQPGNTGNYKTYVINNTTYTLNLPKDGCAVNDSSGATNVRNEAGTYESALETALQNAKAL